MDATSEKRRPVRIDPNSSRPWSDKAQLTLPLAGLEHAEAGADPPCVEIDPHAYDVVIVAFSGGKDSIACVLHLIEMGIRPELWHHDVDGRDDEKNAPLKWDWPVTRSYCQSFAKAFGLDLYFSWRVGGLTGELLKENERTRPVQYERPDGTVGQGGGLTGAISTRRRFPQIGASLLTRWCSSVAKIDVFAIALAGQERFRGKRVLVVTGERAEESANRARYAQAERHRNHQPGPRAQRHVDHWRPVLHWNESEVWDIMRRHGVVAHPAYFLSLGRTSCQVCIFLGDDDLATIKSIAPDKIESMGRLEKSFGCTLKRDGRPITEHAAAGRGYDYDPEIARLAMSSEYYQPIITSDWQLPPGAYRHGAGPT